MTVIVAVVAVALAFIASAVIALTDRRSQRRADAFVDFHKSLDALAPVCKRCHHEPADPWIVNLTICRNCAVDLAEESRG